MGSGGTAADYGRAILLAAAMFGVGYLTGANAPTPMLSRGDPVPSAHPAPVDSSTSAATPAVATPAQLTTAVERLPDSTISTVPMIEGGPTPYALVGLHQQLACVRGAIVLYAMQHNDARPTLDQLQDNWRILTQATDTRGNPSVDKKSGWGPYLDEPPINPVMRSTKVSLAGHAEADSGWTYDPATGQVNAVLPHGIHWQKLERRGAEHAPLTAAAVDTK